ncbi:MAG: sulfite exporter TauE/SafE family protein [Halodesulfurarchaeum sp.]
MSVGMIALFVGFGLLIGILFGFFGMGGSFLVTPALLILGYKSTVAVGSGMAFVFGTSVIATLKHRDLGQVDYKLGVLMIVGTATGIELGKIIVVTLQNMGLAGTLISVIYVLLLGGIGLFVTKESLSSGDGGGLEPDVDAEDDPDESEIPKVAKTIQSYRIPPMIELRGGITVSLWMILAVAFATGLLSGLLGVGGGFIRMPALFYMIGVPVPIAVGTDLFGIVFSGGIGSFLYAQTGGVKLGIVAPLLAGSSLGARLGSAATSIVDEEEIKIYFGVMLLLGSIAVALKELGKAFDIEVLRTVSIVVILGAALLVAGAVVYSSIKSIRGPEPAPSSSSSTAD